MTDPAGDREPFQRYRSIIDDWQAFQAALKRPLPTCIWVNPRKTTPSELEHHFNAQGIGFEPIPWRPGAYRLIDVAHPGSRLAYLAGLYQIQEEVSMLPVALMDLQCGQRVFDACAAPGSKTTEIAAALGPTGTLIANDRNFRRMRPLARSLDRLGLTNTAVMVEDATNLSGDIGTFDRLLADVPCSCEGTSRKNMDARTATADDFRRLNTIQRAILKRCLELARPNARVVYSTCTYAPEENEVIVDDILDEFGDSWQLIPARPEGFAASSGLIEWRGQHFDSQLAHALRVYPHHRDSGGFFVAVFQKRSL